MEKECLFCKKTYKKKAKYSKTQWQKSKYCSLSCGMKYKKNVLGVGKNTQFKKGQWESENHPNWKGEQASYRAKHKWVKHYRGKAKKCEVCGITRDEATIDWANIDHQYRRDLDDYMPMCRSCHRQYDLLFNEYKLG